ncbi:histamine H2 receptor-like [Lytechinus variegatus]|uniref:histamine H2 receptor-like n=1 Tax=Lytechinus variegatus TaxID=7654 RepID=UPI001BB27936|nr:histamine H2 receptor-like [Lytechinus variegatus]
MGIFYTLYNTTTFRLNDFPGRTALYVSISIPLVAVLLAGNILVVVAVFTQGALKKPSYYILTSLAITDLLTGIIGVPFEVYRRTVTDDITCSAKWDVYLTSVTYICGLDSMLLMLLVTFDRYLAVVKPLRYNIYVTPRRILIAVILTWVVAITYNAMLIALGSSQVTVPGFYCSPVRTKTSAATLVVDILTFCLTLFGGVTMVLLNVIILRTAIVQSRRIAAHQCSSAGPPVDAEGREDIKRKIKASKIVLFIVTAFIFCHLPVGIMHLCFVVSEDFALNSALTHVSCLLFYVSSAINPFVYSKMDRVFRQSVVRMLRSCCKKELRDDIGVSATDYSMTHYNNNE